MKIRITNQGTPEYWLDDSQIAAEIFGGLPSNVKSSVFVDREFHDPLDLIALLKRFDLVIATRMHMMILSLGAGTPVLPVVYEFIELVSRLCLKDFSVDIETISPL